MAENLERSRRLLEEAFTWRNEGVSAVPVQPRSKKCLLNWRRFETTLPAQADIFNWFSSGVMNLAVVGGSGGLLVLDFDDPARFAAWQEKAGPLASTYQETTGRGVHLFYVVDNPITRRFEECEALGRGHLCNASPSVHPNLSVYFSPDPLQPLLQVESAKLFTLLSEKPEPTKPARPAEPGQLTPEKTDLVSRIKATLPTLHFSETLTDLKPSGHDGRWWIGRCPFHDDQEASFWVDGQRGLFGCFVPECEAHRGGDLLNLYALSKGVSIQQAVKDLARELLK